MFWTFRIPSITISAELHEKIASTCRAIEEVSSEVIGIRSSPWITDDLAEDQITAMPSCHEDLVTETDSGDHADEYSAHHGYRYWHL